MSLSPLFDAGPLIAAHAFLAMTAFLLGTVQLAAPKGTLPHRTLGYIWVALMATVALSSFFIHDIRMVGPFSWIHLLSIFVLFGLISLVREARRHDVREHRKSAILIFLGGLIVAGFFTFMSGRAMHDVLFGG